MRALHVSTLGVFAMLFAPLLGQATDGKAFKSSPTGKAPLTVQSKTQPRVVSVVPSNNHPGAHESVTFTINRTAPCSIGIYINGTMSGWQPANSASTTFVHKFSAPGTYTVLVKGYQTDPGPTCADQAQTSLTVKPTVAHGLTKPVDPMVTGRSPCPPGTRLKTHNRASGAFSCVIDKAKKPDCPPNTIYYETDCEFGCREYLR